MTILEQGYVEQGYSLPGGWTWDLGAEQRAQPKVSETYVPLGKPPGCVAWAVPIIDGKFMKH